MVSAQWMYGDASVGHSVTQRMNGVGQWMNGHGDASVGPSVMQRMNGVGQWINGVGHSVSQKNPLRWSSKKGVLATIAELEKCSTEDKCRPIDLIVWDLWVQEMEQSKIEETYSNVEAAIAGLRKIMAAEDSFAGFTSAGSTFENAAWEIEESGLPSDRKYGVQVHDQANGEFGAPLYLKGFEGGLRSVTQDGSTTVWEIVEKAGRQFADRPAAGWRRVIKVHQVEEKGKLFEKIELANSYTWMTYSEYLDRVQQFSSGLLSITGLSANSRMVIYAETQVNWMVAALSAFRMSLQVVTIYATLGEEGALYGLEQSQAQVVVADAKLLKILAKIAPKLTHVKYMISLSDCSYDMKQKLASNGINVLSMDEVLAQGRENPHPPRPPVANDVAVVMYTSGTTAAPKGVLISHGNMTAGVAGFQEVASRSGLNEETVYCSYLPLAHIMEMIAETSILSLGASMGFGNPQTLTETGLKLKRPESEGDAVLLRPTFMVFAPAILDKVYQAATKKAKAAGGITEMLFDCALAVGEANYKKGNIGAGFPFNRAFKRIQDMLGGRVSLALTGSAPLSPAIQIFMQTVLNCPVRQGYGLTENCACATIGDIGDNTVKSVGSPQSVAVIRLADWPEGNYMNSDVKKTGIGMPRGEVLIGGPTVSLGYLVDEKNPDPEVQKKNETDYLVIDGIRYFRTGDIGQITRTGCLEIIDRKKDLWKGPQGEYVALTKVEATMKLSPYAEISMCYGKTGGEFVVALICAMEGPVQKLAESLGVTGTFDELCKNSQIVAEVQKDLVDRMRVAKFVDFEIPKKIVLLPSVDGVPAWTPENDLLTAAMKLKRPAIAAAFSSEIDALYSFSA